jgi:hypothetical protein
MTEKFVFGSKEWLDLVQSLLINLTEKAGEKAKDVDFSMCEVYYNAPSHFDVKDNRVAWHFHIKDMKVNFGIGEIDEVDMKVIGEYETMHHISMLEYDSRDQKKVAEIISEPMKTAKFTFKGDASKAPGFLGPLHNMIAERTK